MTDMIEQEETKPKAVFTPESFQSNEEDTKAFNIRNPDGNVIGFMYLRDCKQPIIDKYRDLRNGEGRRKGDPAGARRYLFKRAYVKFEFSDEFAGSELDLSKFTGEQRDKEILFFLDERCEKVVDATLIAYLNETFPDVDSKKS